MGMRAILLDGPPPSGDYREHQFDAGGECTWVLFRPDDDLEWVGVFGSGALGRDGVAVADSGETACVLAGGVAYLVGTADQRLLYRSTEDQLQSVVAVPGQNWFVAADFIRLHVFGSSGPEWSSKRISLDGIRLGAVDVSGLDGLVWTMDTWVPFRLNFDGWRYVCDWTCPY